MKELTRIESEEDNYESSKKRALARLRNGMAVRSSLAMKQGQYLEQRCSCLADLFGALPQTYLNCFHALYFGNLLLQDSFNSHF